MRPRTVGGCLAVAGLVLAVAPFTAGETVGRTWWTTYWSQPGALSAAWATIAAGAILALALVWTGSTVETNASRSLFEADDAEHGHETLHRIGWSCLIVGIALAVGGWSDATQRASNGRLLLTPGETAEHYRASDGDERIKQMLPRRITLTELSFRDSIEATIELKQAGAEQGTTVQLVPGRAIEADDLQFTAIGLKPGDGSLRAVLSSDRPKTIPAAAHPGETFRVTPKGRTYELVEVLENYLGTLGPAARVTSDELGEFLVFGDTSGTGPAPSFRHDLTLERLERVPALVVRVSTPEPLWPSSGGGALMVLGLSLCLTVSNRGDRGEDSPDEKPPEEAT